MFAALSLVIVHALHGQSDPAADRTISARLDMRLGFLVTGTDQFADRPLLQVDGGLQFGAARVGGGPALGVTLGLALESGELFGQEASESARILLGVELPWAIVEHEAGRSAAELVPVLQAGYQQTLGGGKRSGLTMRGAFGLRVIPSRFYFTFEPLSVVLLAPAPRGQPSDSRFGIELGVIKVGWRF